MGSASQVSEVLGAISSLHDSLPMGTTFWKTDADIYISSQQGVLKNTFSSRIWKVFPALAAQTNPPTATGSTIQAPWCYMCFPGGILTCSIPSRWPGENFQWNVVGIHTHPHTCTCKYLSCLLSMSISMNKTSLQQTFTKKEDRNGHNNCLSEL